jgi:hypothetical protein
MGPNRQNDQHPDAWYYAWQLTPSLRERIWEFLSSGVVLLVLGIAAIVMLTLRWAYGFSYTRSDRGQVVLKSAPEHSSFGERTPPPARCSVRIGRRCLALTAADSAARPTAWLLTRLRSLARLISEQSSRGIHQAQYRGPDTRSMLCVLPLESLNST